MNRRSLLAALGGAAASHAAVPSAGAQTAVAAPSIAGDAAPEGVFEILAEFATASPSGVAVTADGRIFVSLPRHVLSHREATLAELREGKLVPFPSAAMSLPSDAPPAERLLSVGGLTIDGQGRLWAIDDGKLVGRPIPPGGAKVVGFNPTSGDVITRLALQSPTLLPDSHVSALAVDLAHGAKGTAFVADASFGTAPALLAVDIASGAARRLLAGHPSVQAEKEFLAILEGRPLHYAPGHPTFPVGGVASLALSADGSRLFYTPLTSRRLYSVSTARLADPASKPAELAAAVTDEGEKGMAAGLATDPAGRLYITAPEHDAVLRRAPDGTIETALRDPRLVWPDGVFATDTHLYAIVSQWNRLPAFNGGHDLRRPPFLLIRAPLGPPPRVGGNAR